MKSIMKSKLIGITALSVFSFVSVAASAQNTTRNDDPNGAAMDRQSDQSPSAKKPQGKIQKDTDPGKNGTSQSESLQGDNKNGQRQ